MYVDDGGVRAILAVIWGGDPGLDLPARGFEMRRAPLAARWRIARGQQDARLLARARVQGDEAGRLFRILPGGPDFVSAEGGGAEIAADDASGVIEARRFAARDVIEVEALLRLPELQEQHALGVGRPGDGEELALDGGQGQILPLARAGVPDERAVVTAGVALGQGTIVAGQGREAARRQADAGALAIPELAELLTAGGIAHGEGGIQILGALVGLQDGQGAIRGKARPIDLLHRVVQDAPSAAILPHVDMAAFFGRGGEALRAAIGGFLEEETGVGFHFGREVFRLALAIAARAHEVADLVATFIIQVVDVLAIGGEVAENDARFRACGLCQCAARDVPAIELDDAVLIADDDAAVGVGAGGIGEEDGGGTIACLPGGVFAQVQVGGHVGVLRIAELARPA